MKMKYTSVKLPVWMVKEIDKIVKRGWYKDRQEFIRSAVRELLKRERAYPYTGRGIPK